MLMTLRSIQKSFGADIILDDVSFIIEEKDKTAVVGLNGAGKTTLFKIITGELIPDAGQLSFDKGLTLGYLSQKPDMSDGYTIYEELQTVFQPVIAMEEELRRLEASMTHQKDAELAAALERYGKLSHDFEENRGYEYKSRLRGVLKGLGFSDEEGRQLVGTLSGGQKTRVALGKLLLTQPPLLLLDEPTNHLDIESVQWLEEFLRDYPGAVLIISHDRYFLDKVVTKVIEIHNKKSQIFIGNYSAYAHNSEADRQNRLRRYVEQQREIKRQEDVIKTLRSYNREKSVKRAESREKMLSKVERLERPWEDGKMRIRLVPKIESGEEVLLADNISKSFDGVLLFQHAGFQIKKGDKVALIGPNGIGKTTLFKILMKLLTADSGKVRLGINVKIGYYDQEHQQLTPSKTILEEISDTYPRLTVGEIRNTLAAFMFTGDDVFKTIGGLSGGEKGRVALSKLMLGNANFLILDEPTNHLDIHSKEILEEALQGYEGTLLYISHDRYFINHTADKVLELTRDGVETYYGNYDYYVEKKKERAQEPPPKSSNSVTTTESPTESLRNFPAGSLSGSEWSEARKSRSAERKAKAALQKLEKDIARMESESAALEQRLTEEEVYSDHILAAEIYKEKTFLEERLIELYEKWEELISAFPPDL